MYDDAIQAIKGKNSKSGLIKRTSVIAPATAILGKKKLQFWKSCTLLEIGTQYFLSLPSFQIPTLSGGVTVILKIHEGQNKRHSKIHSSGKAKQAHFRNLRRILFWEKIGGSG